LNRCANSGALRSRMLKSPPASFSRRSDKDYDSASKIQGALTGHGPLTISRAFTNVPRLIRRGVNLAPVRGRIRLRHCRLIVSPARTDVALFLHRAVRLIILRVADLAFLPSSWRNGAPSLGFNLNKLCRSFQKQKSPLDRSVLASLGHR
jgi:hypothetical protein